MVYHVGQWNPSYFKEPFNTLWVQAPRSSGPVWPIDGGSKQQPVCSLGSAWVLQIIETPAVVVISKQSSTPLFVFNSKIGRVLVLRRIWTFHKWVRSPCARWNASTKARACMIMDSSWPSISSSPAWEELNLKLMSACCSLHRCLLLLCFNCRAWISQLLFKPPYSLCLSDVVIARVEFPI